jgi:lysophospholipase L1-like esterase
MLGGPCFPGLGGRAGVVPVAGYSELLDAGAGVVYSGSDRYVASWAPLGSAATTYLSPVASEPIYEFGGYNGAASICASRATVDRMVAESSALATAMSGLNTPFVTYIACQFIDNTDEAMFSLGNVGSNFHWMEFIAATTGAVVKLFNVDGVPNTGTADTLTANDLLRHVWRIAFDGTLITVERDGVVLLNAVAGYATPGGGGGQTFTRSGLFHLARSGGGNYAKGRIHKRVWYAGKASETADERTQNYAWMNASTSPVTGKSLLLIEGDSTSRTRDGVDVLVPGSWAGLMSLANTVFSNTSIGANSLTVDALANQLRNVNSNYATGYANDAVVLMLGLNDYNSGRTGGQFATDVQTWITSAAAANPSRKIIVCTCPKSALIAGAEDTERAAGNAAILANAVASWGAHAAYDVDGALPEPTSDATIYSDGTHWTSLACQRIATGIQAVLAGFGFT